MKKTNYILLCLMLLVSFACENEDEVNQARPGFSTGVARLDVKVVDMDGSPVSGATVNFFANEADFTDEANSVKMATTDANGIASLNPEDVNSEIGQYFFRAVSGALSNSAGVVNSPIMYWTAGPTVLETTVM